jgi:hypothetical protein
MYLVPDFSFFMDDFYCLKEDHEDDAVPCILESDRSVTVSAGPLAARVPVRYVYLFWGSDCAIYDSTLGYS